MEPLEAPFGGNPPREVVRNLVRRAMARRSCRRARRVIAVSDHVRTFLISKWRLDPASVPVVHHGIDAPQAIAGDAAPGLLRSLPPFRFLFTAGSIRPARGLIDLIRALPQVSGPEHPLTLVIAGATDDGMERHRQDLVGQAERLGVGSRVVWTGGLDDVAMGWCYRNCAAFVMTSRAEACPNVALEAMSYGCACVSVARAPMPEFFGEAAVYYQPGNADGLARAIESALEPARRLSLAAAARARARQFEWDTTASKTAAELRAAVHP
jgi:glycosyltransferase involved in cell wall biosynthesis